MSDARLAAAWLLLLALGLAGSAALRSLGVPRTHVRDLLHIAVGAWPLGWELWQTQAAPVAVACTGLAVVLLVPIAARWSAAGARVVESVSGEGESWTGLVLYAVSVTALTWAGMHGDRFAPAAALLALALGDGLGGAVGRRFGRHRFLLPYAKEKTLEGTLAVAANSASGIVLAAVWFGADASWVRVAGAAAAAAATEALAPRATDNALVPAAVWLVLFGTG